MIFMRWYNTNICGPLKIIKSLLKDILNLSSPEDNVETVEPVDLSIPSVENRPWFMRKGKLR